MLLSSLPPHGVISFLATSLTNIGFHIRPCRGKFHIYPMVGAIHELPVRYKNEIFPKICPLHQYTNNQKIGDMYINGLLGSRVSNELGIITTNNLTFTIKPKIVIKITTIQNSSAQWRIFHLLKHMP